MHTVFALLCFVVVIHWLIFPYPSGLLHWHCGNLTIAPVPAKQPWWIWINTSCEFIMNDCITTTKQSTTKPCAYFSGYTVIKKWDSGATRYFCHDTYRRPRGDWPWKRPMQCFLFDFKICIAFRSTIIAAVVLYCDPFWIESLHIPQQYKHYLLRSLLYDLDENKMNLPSNLNFNGQTGSKIGPWSGYNASSLNKIILAGNRMWLITQR